MTAPFKMIETILADWVKDTYTPASTVLRVGGDLDYQPTDDLYVYISLVAGGSSDQIFGEWALDIDCFAKKYATAMNHALALEALILSSRIKGDGMILDASFQNEAPLERPWDEDKVYRVGATYVFTARRSG